LKSWSWVFACYVFVVFLLCILPVNGEKSSVNQVFIVHIRLDYWIHAVMFIPWMGLAIIRYRGIGYVTGRPALLNAMLFFSGILFAFFCESIQYFTTWRTFNINDLIANLLGVLLGLPVWIFLSWKGGRKRGDTGLGTKSGRRTRDKEQGVLIC
jgi:glycopeptide antibiotics resistance protein